MYIMQALFLFLWKNFQDGFFISDTLRFVSIPFFPIYMPFSPHMLTYAFFPESSKINFGIYVNLLLHNYDS